MALGQRYEHDFMRFRLAFRILITIFAYSGPGRENKQMETKTMEQSFISMVRQSIHDNWSLEALTDYHGSTLKYQDVAHDIEVLHLLFQCTGIKPGDKVALCGRNSSRWGVVVPGHADLRRGVGAHPARLQGRQHPQHRQPL
jgi:acyl-CoA synthetase (AMP-forming)/AMP-acid ligase II